MKLTCCCQVLSTVEVAPPVLLPMISRRHKTHGYLCYLNSRGEVTAYHHGSRVWQV
jgi:hypothetical protein